MFIEGKLVFKNLAFFPFLVCLQIYMLDIKLIGGFFSMIYQT